MTPDTLAALHSECFTMPRPWSAAEFASLLNSTGTFLHGGKTGFILGRVIADEVELLTLAVAPAARRSGLGRSLLKAYEDTARTRGATESFLEVAATNTAAIALYSAHGYRETGRRTGYYRTASGPNVDALIFARALS